jgi:hypothetical protein
MLAAQIGEKFGGGTGTSCDYIFVKKRKKAGTDGTYPGF